MVTIVSATGTPIVPPLKEVRKVKRLFAVIATAVASLALAVPAADAAPTQAANSCSGGNYFLLSLASLHYGVNGTGSPYTLRIAGSGETEYCKPGSSGSYNFEQNGTSRCLNVDTSNATITEGNCSLVRARWDTIADGTFMGENVWEIKNDYIGKCIYYNGLGDNATYNTCSSSNGDDAFIIH
jgi:hypothetical protein